MKIKKIHISSFGKLKDKNVDFENGFNLIYGENEQGKTTLMEFIKMMFYGSKGRGNEITKNTRIKYRPWDNSVMSGKIYFEHQNKNYCLEREFGSSNATDTITLTDTDKGNTQKYTGKENFGEKIFGLGIDAFEKTVFINNSLSSEQNNEADGEINSKLSNISTTADENVSFELVDNRLSTAMDAIKTPKRRGGSIAKIENELEALNEEKLEIISRNAERDALANQLSQKQAEFDALESAKKSIFEEIKGAEKSEKIEKLQKFIEAATIYENIEKQLTDKNGALITSEFLEKAKQDLANLKTSLTVLEEKTDELERTVSAVAAIQNGIEIGNHSDLSSLKSAKANTAERLSLLENQATDISARIYNIANNKKPAKAKLILLIIGAILTVLGFVGTFAFDILFFIPSFVGILCLILGLIIKGKGKNSQKAQLEAAAFEINSKIAEGKKKLSELDDAIRSIEIEQKTEQGLLDTRKREALDKQSALLELKEVFSKSSNEFLSFFATYKVATDLAEAEAMLNQATELVSDLEKARLTAEYAANGTGCSNLSDAKQKLSMLGGESKSALPLSVLQEKLKTATEDCNHLSIELTALKTRLRTEFTSLKTPEEIEGEIKAIEEEYNEQLHYYNALALAREGLADAFALMRRDFGSVIEKRAIELFGKLTNDKYTDISVSKNFEMRVTGVDSYTSKEIEYLSRGAFDQAYFALRLALSELMSQSEGSLPVLLDDVFSQYDDTRLQTAIEFLKDYSNENQVLYFTCHKQVEALSKEQNANIIKL